jgi:hypothetical protein
VTAADAAAYASDRRQGQSVDRVTAREKLTDRQALEAMLVPLRQHHRLDAGALGRRPATGIRGEDEGPGVLALAAQHAVRRRQRADPATVSTASDQFWLAVRALQIPAFRQIVAMPQVTLPVTGMACNLNAWPRARWDRGRQDRLNLERGRVPGLRRDPGGRRRPGHDHRRRARRKPATSTQPSELGGVITAAEHLLASVGGDLEHA